MATYTKQCTQVGSFTYANLFTLYIVLTEKDVNIANNTSSVDYNVYCQSSGSGSISANHLKYFNINGSDKINTTVKVDVKSPNAYIAIASGNTGAIAHNSDGTKSINFSAQIKATSYGVSASLSGTFTLGTIPRTSSVSFPTTNIGSSNNISINRASSSFTHTLTYSFGTLTGTIATKTTSTSIAWTVPDNFYGQIPNATTGRGTITCITYSGNTEIGRSTCQLNANAVSSVAKPTVTVALDDINETTLALTGRKPKTIILNASTGRLTITTTLNKSAGSIKSITVNNTATSIAPSRTIDYAKISISSFSVTVTDSRGYSTTVSPTGNTFINYVPLSLSASFTRPQPTTGQVNLQYSGNYWNGNFKSGTANTLTASYKYKEHSASAYTTGIITITPTIQSGNKYTRSATSLGTSFDYTKQYDFQLTVSDRLNTLTYNGIVSQGLPIIQWNKNTFRVNGTLDCDLSANAGTPAKSNSFDNVNEGQDFYRSGLYTFYEGTSSKWFNVINIRHRNGISDGNKHGMQIISRLTDVNYSIGVRKQTNGNWTGFEDIYRAKLLFDNGSGQTGTVTLNETSANFNLLEIYYIDNNNRNYHCTKVYSPNGKNASLSINEGWVENNAPRFCYEK